MLILFYIGVVHSLFIMLFLFSKQRKTQSELIIILWMVFLFLPMLAKLLVSPLGYGLAIPLLKEKLPFALTYGPLLILYTSQITCGNRWNRNQYIWHFMPFVIGSIYKINFVPDWDFNPNLDPNNTILGNLLSATILISTLSYSAWTLLRLKKYKLEVLNQFSYISIEISLKWLKWLAFCLIASSFLPFFAIFFSLPELFHQRIFALLLFMFILSFFGLKQSQVFYYTNTDQNTSTLELNIKPYTNVTPPLEVNWQNNKLDRNQKLEECDDKNCQKEKYQRSGLSKDKSMQILARLERFMTNERPHLDSDLTANKLAEQLGIPRHHLTQVFSEQLDKNFYMFINEHRVKAVKELLKDPSSNSIPLIEIAHHCGFNSKSTFNKMFKSITGLTPSQYRKKNS